MKDPAERDLLKLSTLKAPMPIDNRAERNWDRAENAYQHYQSYIMAKKDKYSLTFVDLIFVKNFKGGSSLIAEPISTLSKKIMIARKPFENAPLTTPLTLIYRRLQM